MSALEYRYDLEERTSAFSEQVIHLCRQIPLNILTRSIINQLMRSATSIGANYAEANGASSKKDFRNKIFICKKEARETVYWLRMLAAVYPGKKDDTDMLREEAQELVLIFQKITSTLGRNAAPLKIKNY